VPTLGQLQEQLKEKIRKWGPDAHCGVLVVSEEARLRAIQNEPDETGKRRTRISLETYSPESYSNWNQALEYLVERCSFNPVLLVDLLLLLIQEARRPLEAVVDPSDGYIKPGGKDGIDLALQGLWKVNGDYEERLREAKAQYRARKRK